MSTKEQRRAYSAVAAVLVVLAICSARVECQFLQPQSHLGRLVQSITSPLVLSSAAYGGDSAADSDDSTDVSPQQSAGAGHMSPSSPPESSAAQHFQHYHQQQQPTAGRYHQQQALLQAPSQERGVPQRYYGQQARDSSQTDDEDSGAPSSPRKQHSHAGGREGQEYAMGAYLGPTIDDKEIQGAFNSNNDERDEDDGAAGFAGPQAMGGGARQRAASAHNSADEMGGGESSPYEPTSSQASGYGPALPYGNEHSGADSAPASPYDGASSTFDDETNADEDDEPRAARRPVFRTPAAMNQAASHQRRQHSSSRPQQMQAAANGYAPYGYGPSSGPIDLNSLVAAAGGGVGGYEVYTGDGSYGPGPGYHPQQQQRGGRQAAGSMAGPYDYDGQQPSRGRDNDDQDDADED